MKHLPSTSPFCPVSLFFLNRISSLSVSPRSRLRPRAEKGAPCCENQSGFQSGSQTPGWAAHGASRSCTLGTLRDFLTPTRSQKTASVGKQCGMSQEQRSAIAIRDAEGFLGHCSPLGCVHSPSIFQILKSLLCVLCMDPYPIPCIQIHFQCDWERKLCGYPSSHGSDHIKRFTNEYLSALPLRTNNRNYAGQCPNNNFHTWTMFYI